jgi:hypothetical protein
MMCHHYCSVLLLFSVVGVVTVDDGVPKFDFFELESDPMESESLLTTYPALKDQFITRLSELSRQRVNATTQGPHLTAYAACGRACTWGNVTWKRTVDRQRFNNATAHATNNSRPPHIMFVLADDLGYNDLG